MDRYYNLIIKQNTKVFLLYTKYSVQSSYELVGKVKMFKSFIIKL